MTASLAISDARGFLHHAAGHYRDFFVLSGQLTYVAEIGNWFSNWHCQADARARLIFLNGTES
ncbi:hypothetical protein G0D83_12550 [Yangia sp. PrR003]|nr:hypothetical protein [Salipiger sp. PrR003]